MPDAEGIKANSPGFQSWVQITIENGVLKGRRKHGDNMPQSLHSNFVHIVFSTKSREPMIGDDVAGRIHSYLAGIAQDQSAVSISINGMPDHVHLLIKSSKTVADANFMKELKGGSSSWINKNKIIPGHFKWQAGYGWFSVSPKDTDQVVSYIQNQAEHHKKVTFQEEYRKFLKSYNIEYDERYVWD
ncbi:MAG: IS200/IS605 family transposase [Verrucomicrobia bacterium]|nr:IS200/IS605 family transposase [Verrucomicrobiota bacterium]